MGRLRGGREENSSTGNNSTKRQCTATSGNEGIKQEQTEARGLIEGINVDITHAAVGVIQPSN